jgi:UDP-glucose 4-epimerase
MGKKFSGERILITGGNGQVGSRLVERLKKSDVVLYVLDISPLSPYNNEIKFLKCDITKEEQLKFNKGSLKEIDLVVHLASVIEGSTDICVNAIPSIDVNILGTLNLLKYVESASMVLYSSSYMVYGIPQYNPVDESHPTDPQCIYGTSKLGTEKYLQIYSNRMNIPVAILRFMGIYGPRLPADSGQAIPNFIKCVRNNIPPHIYGNGSDKRNHVYIDDAVDAIILALEKRSKGIYNIGGDRGYSAHELAEIIIQLSEKSLEPVYLPRTGVEHDFVCDISLAESELSYSPKVDIREGLLRTLKKNGENEV